MLIQLQGVGDITAKRLIAHCGSVDAVFEEKKNLLLKIPGIYPSVIQSMKDKNSWLRAEKEVVFMEKNGIKALFFQDNNYPARLKQCNDGPVLLFVKGEQALESSRMLAIIGTRQITSYGRELTEELVSHFKETSTIIVSGMAHGIDTCAHRSALDQGLVTHAVLGHGFKTIYPAGNRALAGRIKEQGVLFTEFMSDAKPDRENFPKRNRIVAGMVDAVVVVEAAITGGALITAAIANSYGREVFAFPGNVGSSYSEGTNRLIFSNRAALVTNGADVEYHLGWDIIDKSKTTIQIPLFEENDCSTEERVVIDRLRQQKQSGIDDLFLQCGLSSGKLAEVLLSLELNGKIKTLPGKRYQLCFS